jgi:hypothetical protein
MHSAPATHLVCVVVGCVPGCLALLVVLGTPRLLTAALAPLFVGAAVLVVALVVAAAAMPQPLFVQLHCQVQRRHPPLACSHEATGKVVE